jgi:hypothetical protein
MANFQGTVPRRGLFLCGNNMDLTDEKLVHAFEAATLPACVFNDRYLPQEVAGFWLWRPTASVPDSPSLRF